MTWVLDDEYSFDSERVCKKCGRINTHRLDKDGNFTCDGEWMDVPEGTNAQELQAKIRKENKCKQS